MSPARLCSVLTGLIAFAISLVACAGEMVNVPTRPGVSVNYWLQVPAGAEPDILALLFVGGEGAIKLPSHVDGSSLHFGAAANFLVRIQDQLATAPVATVLIDAPSDHATGMDDWFRASAKHAEDIGAVLDDLQRRYPKAHRVLIGTSRGTISVAYLATRLASKIDGIVLTSLVMNAPRRGGIGLSSFDFSQINVPTLLVQHHDDQCVACTYDAVAKLGSRFPLVTVHGGLAAATDECEPLSHHGFYGKEAKVAATLRQWMQHQPYANDIE